MSETRNAIIFHTADVVIAIGGDYGTLSEIALERKIGRAFVGLGTWPLGQDAAGQPHVLVVSTPEEAVAAALARCGRNHGT
jgi:hypothetical protein